MGQKQNAAMQKQTLRMNALRMYAVERTPCSMLPEETVLVVAQRTFLDSAACFVFYSRHEQDVV